jgi:hypothetical protein
MPRRSRPANATFIAVCNILLGLPCLCCSGLISFGHGADVIETQQANPANAAAQGPAADNEGDDANAAKPKNMVEQLLKENDESEAYLQKELPRRSIINLGIGIVLVIASLLLSVSGVLLLMNRPFGRTLCLAAAAIMLIGGLADAGYGIGVERPATEKFDRLKAQELKAKNQPPVDVTETEGLWVAIGVKAFLCIGYPVLAIAVMMTGLVRNYYRRTPNVEDELDRYHGDANYRRAFDDEFDADR